MQILALSSEFPPYRGGISTYALEMAHSAAELGAKVTVATADFGGDRTADDAKTYPFKIIRYRGGLHTMRDIPAKVSLVGQLLDEGRYDVVHAMDWPFFLPLALNRRTIGKKHGKRLHTIHGSDVIDMSAGYKRLAIRLSGMFNRQSEVVANSAFTRDLFLRHFPDVDPGVARYELLGVGEFWREPAEKADAVRAEYKLPEDKFLVVTIARMTPRKGHLGVIEGLARLPEATRARICYAIVGPAYEADYAAEVDAAIARSGCDIRRLGEVPRADLRRLCAAADLFCLVGKPIPNGPVEGFGLVFLEAGGQGLPAVAGDIGGVKEVVLDGENGVLVPVEEPQKLADAIAALVDDPERVAQLGKGARKRAEELTWGRCAAGTYSL